MPEWSDSFVFIFAFWLACLVCGFQVRFGKYHYKLITVTVILAKVSEQIYCTVKENLKVFTVAPEFNIAIHINVLSENNGLENSAAASTTGKPEECERSWQ